MSSKLPSLPPMGFLTLLGLLLYIGVYKVLTYTPLPDLLGITRDTPYILGSSSFNCESRIDLRTNKERYILPDTSAVCNGYVSDFKSYTYYDRFSLLQWWLSPIGSLLGGSAVSSSDSLFVRELFSNSVSYHTSCILSDAVGDDFCTRSLPDYLDVLASIVQHGYVLSSAACPSEAMYLAAGVGSGIEFKNDYAPEYYFTERYSPARRASVKARVESGIISPKVYLPNRSACLSSSQPYLIRVREGYLYPVLFLDILDPLVSR